MTQGFLKIAAATPKCTLADCGTNTASILALIKEAAEKNVRLVVFPELAVTGYTCGDLFSQELLERVSLSAVRLIAEKTQDIPITSVIGFPFSRGNKRYNCAAVIAGGKILGIVPKTHIQNYGELNELRHFSPAPKKTEVVPAGIFGPYEIPFGTNILFTDSKYPDISFAIEIGEDLQVACPPSSFHTTNGALLIANLSASSEIAGKQQYRRNTIASQSNRCICGYIYANAGSGESSTDLVFGGHNLIAEYGTVLAESSVFTTGLSCAEIDLQHLISERRRIHVASTTQETSTEQETAYLNVQIPLVANAEGSNPLPLTRKIDPQPFVPASPEALSSRCEEVFTIQAAGLAQRLSHTGIKTAVIGLSGGLDSTLALLVTIRAFDQLGLPRKGILAITMPGFGTTAQTKRNALKLADLVGISSEEIKINKAVTLHFKDIGQDPKNKDTTYENAQARERTQILMDRGNMIGGFVIGTGDMSELALGWTTYNGDHMSMYAVNASVPKTLLRHIVAWCAASPEDFMQDADSTEKETLAEQKKLTKVLTSILDTPVSPELLPPKDGKISQETEHIVGPYELHDFFLYHLVRWGSSPARILFLAEQAFSTSYTRQDIFKWLNIFYRRFFSQQFKRSCMPDAPKVGSVNLSPRGDWQMPSDASAALWLKDLSALE